MERTTVCISFILSHLSAALGASAARFGRNSVRYKIAVQHNAIFGLFSHMAGRIGRSTV
jgi:hypothetical protein